MSRKVVLVTGASRGIGKATALKFAKMGCDVAISCIHNEALLLQTQKEVEAFQVSSLTFLGDMGRMEDCISMFDQIQSRLGSVDILINNAGISHIGLLQDMESEDWDRVLRTNLTSVFNCCKLAISPMVAKKQGKIINISSVWGLSGASCEAAYSASKGGINALTKALARELAPSGIQVNAIACGAVDTEMNRFLQKEELNRLIEEIPAGRLATASEVADLAWALGCADSYLTGQVIGLDGGWI